MLSTSQAGLETPLAPIEAGLSIALMGETPIQGMVCPELGETK